MKKLFTSIFVLTLVACSSTSPNIVKGNQVSEQNKLDAFNFATQQFEGCITGKFCVLTTETSTPYLVRELTDADMKSACEKINKMCGEIKELKLVQILHEKRGYIYRFKAKYSEASCAPEIRVYTNLDHKFDGLIYKPKWEDKYAPYNP